MAIVVRNIILIFFLTAILVKGRAQNAVNLQKRIAIQVNIIRLDSLLHAITKQSGARFSINTSKIQGSKMIAIKDHTPTIASVLQVIKQSTGVYYATLGDHIILLDNPPPAKRKTNSITNKQTAPAHNNAIVKSKPPVTGRQSIPVKKVTITNKPAAPSHPMTILDPDLLIKLDNTASKPKPDTVVKHPISISKPPVLKQSIAANNTSTPPAAPEKEKQRFINNLFVKTGLSADDLFYCNPTIQIGKPYLYGIASYNTNFKISGFRYGAGTSITLSDPWKLHLQLTTGNFTSKNDTMDLHWEYKTQLHRAGLIVETDLGDHFKIQFGPVFNLMKLTFYQNGKKTAPGTIPLNTDNKFELLKPVYTVSDTWSKNTANSSKTWIGLQVSIFYNFNFYNPE